MSFPILFNVNPVYLVKAILLLVSSIIVSMSSFTLLSCSFLQQDILDQSLPAADSKNTISNSNVSNSTNSN